MNNQKSPFGDSKGLLAIVLIGAFFALWNWYMSKTYPQKPKAPTATVQSEGNPQAQSPAPTGPSAPVATTNGQTVATQEMKSAVGAAEKTFRYEGDKLSFEISSRGMGLKNVTLNDFTDRKGGPIRMSESSEHTLFEVALNNSATPLNFDLTEKAKGHYVGTAEADGMTIVREIRYDESKQAFNSSVELKNVKPNTTVDILIPEKIVPPESSSFLFPSYNHQDFFVGHEGTTNSVNFSSAKADVRSQYNNVNLAAISSQYFTVAVLDQSDVIPSFTGVSDLTKKEALARLTYKPAQAAQFSQLFFVGPKSIDVLQNIHPQLTEVINLGSLSFIAKPMLLFMKAAYTWVKNWGLAIIMLTLLVRLAVFPLYVMSIKSMKAMQIIQPQMKALQEKYKDDKLRLNQEVMALMKQHNANPMKGCLPMLLQIPIFFALFRVISTSVELYQAPFGLWIHDLSQHDKFFVLPVAMGLLMYLQQRITPTNMPPEQAKVMALMPVIFSVFMLYLPSGLTLYMFVSAVFGFAQQYLMMKKGGTKVPTMQVEPVR